MKRFLLILCLIFGISIPANCANVGKFNILLTPDNSTFKNCHCYRINNNSFISINTKDNNIIYSILNIDTNKYSAQGKINGYSEADILPLKNGKIFIFGKNNPANDMPADAYVCIFNPNDNTYSKTAKIPYPTFGTSLLELNNGNILVTGANYKHDKVLEYDIKTNTFIQHPDLKEKRFGHKSIEIEPNKILLLGGEGKNIEIYDLNNNTSEIIDIGLKTVNWGKNTKLYSIGNNNYLFFTKRVFNETDGSLTEATQIIDPENPKSGYEKFYYRDYIGILNLQNKTIEEIIPDEKFKLSGYDIELLPNNKVLIAGGTYSSVRNGLVTLNTAKTYDLKTKRLTSVDSKMNFPRETHKILKINENKYLIYEGINDNSVFLKPEIFVYTSSK